MYASDEQRRSCRCSSREWLLLFWSEALYDVALSIRSTMVDPLGLIILGVVQLGHLLLVILSFEVSSLIITFVFILSDSSPTMVHGNL